MSRQRRLFIASTPLLVFLLLLVSPRDCGKRAVAERVSAEVVTVRLKPFRTATGLETKMVYVEWKNTGDRPIRLVEAQVTGFDVDGREVWSLPGNSYPIYVEFSDRPGIAAGEVYVPPDGQGLVVPPKLTQMPTRVTAEIKKVAEHGVQ